MIGWLRHGLWGPSRLAPQVAKRVLMGSASRVLTLRGIGLDTDLRLRLRVGGRPLTGSGHGRPECKNPTRRCGSPHAGLRTAAHRAPRCGPPQSRRAVLRTRGLHLDVPAWVGVTPRPQRTNIARGAGGGRPISGGPHGNNHWNRKGGRKAANDCTKVRCEPIKLQSISTAPWPSW